MPRVDTRFPTVRSSLQEGTLQALRGVYAAQSTDILDRVSGGAAVLLPAVWDGRLAGTLGDRMTATASTVAALVARAFGNDDYDPDVMAEWLAEVSAGIAEAINAQTRERLDGADLDRATEVTDNLQDGGARRHALSVTTTAANFGARDAGEKSGAGLKRWQVNSTNPRSSHQALSGVTVPIGDTFPGGLRWPGDGPAKQTANCRCSLTIL